MSMYALKNDEGEWLGCWFDHGGLIWDTRSIAEENAKLYGGHVVELVEAPANIVVSKEEAEMLKRANLPSLRPSFAITEYSNSHEGNILGSDLEDRLMRAYVNGYTVEKPKRWNVKVPHADAYWFYLRENHKLAPISDRAYARDFTAADIDHYGLQDCEKLEVKDDN